VETRWLERSCYREAAQPDDAGFQLGHKLLKSMDSECLGLRELQKSVFPFFAIYFGGLGYEPLEFLNPRCLSFGEQRKGGSSNVLYGEPTS